ncbi:MAG: tetratricopeptide repeat protein [Deltaproteobacteria bacterium]|nr:tetratricopeptide repeat protein [Deltaproteobacteria bacterium]
MKQVSLTMLVFLPSLAAADAGVTAESAGTRPQAFYILSLPELPRPDLGETGLPEAAVRAVRDCWRADAALQALSIARAGARPSDERGRLDRELLAAERRLAVERERALSLLARATAPEALFVRARLEWDRAQETYLQAMEAFEAALRARERGAPGELSAEPRLALGPALAQLEALLAQHPKHELADDALLLTGYLREQQARPAAAVKAWRALIRAYPESPHAVEAWLRLGEILFDEGSLAEAAEAYERALASEPQGRYAEIALYKLGWSLYRQDRYPQAALRFAELLERIEGGRTSRPELRSEALQYLVFCFSEPRAGGGLAGLRRFLGARGRTAWGPDAMALLGEVYLAEARYMDAVAALRAALDAAPLHPANPDRARGLVIALRRAGREAEAEAAARDLGARFGPGSDWAEANPGRGPR